MISFWKKRRTDLVYWYTIYHHNTHWLFNGVAPAINQPATGKKTSTNHSESTPGSSQKSRPSFQLAVNLNSPKKSRKKKHTNHGSHSDRPPHIFTCAHGTTHHDGWDWRVVIGAAASPPAVHPQGRMGKASNGHGGHAGFPEKIR